MSLQPQTDLAIPQMTHVVAQAAFPNGNVWLTMRDELGPIFEDTRFADLFPPQGQPAEAPWRLALVVLMQFAENLPDRQAAEAVRSRIDWKYALGLELTDPGFDYSVLSEFRTRLLHGQAEQRLLETVLALGRERGWLKARGKQRTDSTHVLGAIHVLNRLECVGETLRHALNSLAEAAPEWLRSHMQAEWADRYGKRLENYRLPREKAQREALAVTMGADGFTLLSTLAASETPEALRHLPAVVLLRRVWIQQYVFEAGQLRWRTDKELPPASVLICSPYDEQARHSIKRQTEWSGYKTHLTETCEPDAPHLIIHVATTPGTTADNDVTETIHADLHEADLLPREHFADEGYLDAQLLVDSPQRYGVELFGPVAADGSWQARSGHGYDHAQFVVDWPAQTVTCPQGKQSYLWMPQKDDAGNPVIHVKFAAADCQACAVRSVCTRSRSGRRELCLRPREAYEALQRARTRQKTRAFQEHYAVRAGVEGTLSQGVRVCGMRRSRYIGLAKTHLQHLATATALNVLRMVAWLMEVPLAKTSHSRFAALCTPTLVPSQAA